MHCYVLFPNCQATALTQLEPRFDLFKSDVGEAQSGRRGSQGRDLRLGKHLHFRPDPRRGVHLQPAAHHQRPQAGQRYHAQRCDT